LLQRGDQELQLRPKAFAVLVYLVEEVGPLARDKLSGYRKYHRTHRTMISASKCRPLNSAGRFRLIYAEACQIGRIPMQHARKSRPQCRGVEGLSARGA
jgi:hypothetical protein